MLGSMPCKLPSEIHVDGQLVDRKGVEELGDNSAGSRQKRTWVLTAKGREVVGPGYMEHACIGVHGHTDRSMQGRIHSKISAYRARDVPDEEVNMGGGGAATLKGRRG
jgi:hypothetical protein